MKEQLVEEIEKDIKEKNTMSKEYEGKVNKRIFSNILIAIVILIYLILITIGSRNIENNIFIVDLKVFSIILSVASILIFERSYKAADGKLCIYGVETLILAIMTLVGVYIFQINQEFFIPLIAVIAIIVAVYYLIKSIGIYGKSKKEYIKNQNDINEIVKEELPETVETKRRRNVLENAMNTYEELNNQEDDDNNVIRSRKLKTSTRKVEDNENYDNEFDESIMIFKEKSIEEIEPKATTKKNTTRKTTKKADPESTKTAKTTATKKATTSKKTTATKEKIEPKEEKKEATTKKNTTKAKAPKKEETAEKKTTSKAKTAKKEETVEKKTTTKKDAEEEKTKATKKTTTAKKTTTKKKDETKK